MSQLSLVQRQSAEVLHTLRQRLAQHDATAGSRLPPERQLALDLNVSRRVLREALQTLEDEGLILRGPGKGTVIVGNAQKYASGTRLAPDIRQYTSPIDLMDARFALEPAIAARAAAHATTQDIDHMHACIERSQSAVADAGEWEKWDGALHAAIGLATKNTILVRFYEIITAARDHTAWGRLRKASLTPERQALYTEQHKQIVAAIEERDPDLAAKMMKQHLVTVRRTMIEQLEDN